MKKIKKLLAIVGIAISMSATIIPLAGWTEANVQTDGGSMVSELTQECSMTSLQPKDNFGVMPLYGGSESYTFVFEEGKTITFTASAGNWIWPYKDEAVITVNANFDQAYYSFQVRFIWTNASGRETVWSCPGQLDEISGYPFMLVSSENNYTIKHKKKCTDADGNPGSGWSCDHIIVRAFARCGNGKVKATEIGPVYF